MRDIVILVADDEATVRQFLDHVIRKENLPVADLLEADNGLDAVALAKEHRPDLIFLDIRMPGQDGLKAAKTLMRDGYLGKIVIVTAYSDFEFAREALRTGVSEYLLKPVKPKEFAKFILQVAQSDQGYGQGAEQSVVTSVPEWTPVEEKAQPVLVRTVLAHIAENLHSRLRIEDIAKVVHVSPWHLSRTFKRLDGRSIMDCVRTLRIDRARELLADHDLSVTEIAIMVGFENAGYFATCFKQATNLSPSAFRKKHAL